jgi:protein phosphatase
MEINARTEVGLVREQNEDSFLSCVKRGLMVVADGMGGHLAGEIASQLAVRVFDRGIGSNDGSVNPRDLLKKLAQEANQEIFSYASSNPGCEGMGTTLTAALVYHQRVFLVHVGDSRAYLIRPGKIRRITADHSVVEELLRWGAISEEEALHHPYRNMLTRALGTETTVKLDLIEETFHPGDYLLLCTDGLTNLVTDQEIYAMVEHSLSIQMSLDKMVDLALSRGGQDNITVVLGQLDYRGEVS